MTSPTLHDRFRQLHASGCFVIPNPWDIGSAVLLERMGFRALATTSAGFAWALGRRDNRVTLEQSLEHYRALVDAASVPINADFGTAFAIEPADVAANVTRAAATGVCGISIEDTSGDDAAPLFDAALALERVRAARHALDGDGGRVLLVARTEGFLVGRPDLDETIRRLVAFADAGADCLYAPGIRTREQVAAVVKAVAPTPVNVLVGSDFTTVAEMAELGVRRISVGGALARAAWGGFLAAAREIAEDGTFAALARGASYAEMEQAMPG